MRNKHIMFSSILALLFVVNVRTYEVPDWQSLQQKLHDKVEEIFQNDRTETYKKIHSGNFFKYILDDSATYEAVEQDTNRLPSWLTFDAKNNKLTGIPSEADVKKGLKIKFQKVHKNSMNEVASDSKFLQLDILSNPEPFKCKHDVATVAYVVFHANLNKYVGDKLVKFMRNFANHLDSPSIKDLLVESGNRMDRDGLISHDLRMAGPGDKRTTWIGKEDESGFTVSWLLKCGYDLAGDKTVAFLRELSQKENSLPLFHEPVLGWFITSNKQNRARRAVAGGTPGATPSVSSVQVGTPTFGPTPSVVVKTTAIVKPTPSKSIGMPMTSMPTIQPPIITTTELITTKEVTKPSTTTKHPSTKKPTGKPGNHNPILITPMKAIVLFEHQALQKKISSTMFYDEDEDDYLTIDLKYKTGHGFGVAPPDWITYNNKNLYMLPENKHVGRHTFSLTATDPSGDSVTAGFDITVKRDPYFYNNIFNVTFDLDFSSVKNSVEKRVKLVKILGKATSQGRTEDYKYLRSLQFVPGSVVIQWSVAKSGNYTDCRNNPEVQTYKARIDNDDFKAEFENIDPPIDVLSTGLTEKKPCDITPVPGAVGEDDSLWVRILIPVIVIIVILLIIALILCSVYRRRRKYEPQEEDKDGNYLNHKKPVIFLEEYDEKPDFMSLQPLILPNEKPPVPAQAYEPRTGTPDAPESSTVSTESDERAPLAPSSPSDSPRKGYNAPPPYSAHL